MLVWNQYPWKFGNIGCKFGRFVSELVTYVSIFTMITFTVERYKAVCNPVSAYLVSNDKRRTGNIIVGIWFLAIFPSALMSHFVSVEYVDFGKEKVMESAICMITPLSVKWPTIALTVFTSTVLYGIPICILPVLYIR